MADQIRPVINPELRVPVRVAAAAAGFANPTQYVNQLLTVELAKPPKKRHVPALPVVRVAK